MDALSIASGGSSSPHTRAKVAWIFFSKRGDQFAIAGDQRLLGFDPGDEGLLGGKEWECNFELANLVGREILENGPY